MLDGMGITREQYGVLNSAVSWPALMLVPVAAGYFMDTRPTRYAVVFFSFLPVLGHLMFTLAVISNNYTHAVLARFIFGIGESAMTVAPGIICLQWFRSEGQIAMALGFVEASRSLANLVGKVSINFGLFLGGWEMSLWFGLAMCVLSLHMSFLYFIIESNTEQQLDSSDFISTKSRPQSNRSCGVKCMKQLPTLFWMFCILNFFYHSPKHLFDSVSADFIYEKWDVEWTNAIWLTSIPYSLPLLLAPIVGYVLDWTSYRMAIATFALVLLTAAHLILGLTFWSPLLGLGMMSVTESCIPTILSFSIPLIVPYDLSGVAFGVYTIIEKFGKVVGDPLVGRIRDSYGDYVVDESIFAAMAFCAVLCCIAIIVMDSEKLLSSDIAGTAVKMCDTAERHAPINDRTDIPEISYRNA